MLEWRLDAYRRWLTMREPQWARVDYGPIDYQDLYYYSAPKRKALASLDEVDPEILKTYAKLGIPLIAPPSRGLQIVRQRPFSHSRATRIRKHKPQ